VASPCRELAESWEAMDLFLRKENHPQASDNHRVVVRDGGDEIEVGSIGVQFKGWARGIDNIIPMRDAELQGTGKDRADCMKIGPAAAQRYDPAYPVCLHVYGREANYYECSYTSLPQCNASASGRCAECEVNPYFAGAGEPAGHRRHRRVY
jgi:hypothetical protein